jgi:cytoskeleton protein RodZ
MPSFGEHLKQIREAKGLSIEDLVRVSKINLRFLVAMEAEHFEILPGGVFNRGIVKTYAKYCGGDETVLLAEYDGLVKPKRDTDLNLLQTESPRSKPANDHRWIAIVAGIVVIVLAIWLIIKYRSGSDQSTEKLNTEKGDSQMASSAPPASATPQSTQYPARPPVLPPSETSPAGSNPSPHLSSAPPSTNSPMPVSGAKKEAATVLRKQQKPETQAGEISPTAESQPPEPSLQVVREPGDSGARAEPGSMTLRVDATEDSWLSIRRDGEEVYRKVIRPHESLQFTAKVKFDVVCGNAGGIVITLDGKALPPLGQRGEVKTATYTRSQPAAETTPPPNF